MKFPKCENESICRHHQYFDMYSLKDSIEMLKNYSIEEQVEIYIYGVRYRHPPALHIGRALFERELETIPVLIEKLRLFGDNESIDFAKIICERIYDRETDSERKDLFKPQYEQCLALKNY
jgi:hypothetical protein